MRKAFLDESAAVHAQMMRRLPYGMVSCDAGEAALTPCVGDRPFSVRAWLFTVGTRLVLEGGRTRTRRARLLDIAPDRAPMGEAPPSDFAVHVAPGSHLDDADMLRHLDNEPAVSPIGDAVVHLRDCVACAARADVLRRRRMALAFLLTDADVAAAPMAVPKALLDGARARSRWHASGSLSIVSDTGTLATVERLGGDNLELLVISHGLSVRNAPGQTVFYRVRLPHRVARVYLRSGHTTSLGDQVITVSDSVVRIYLVRDGPGENHFQP